MDPFQSEKCETPWSLAERAGAHPEQQAASAAGLVLATQLAHLAVLPLAKGHGLDLHGSHPAACFHQHPLSQCQGQWCPWWVGSSCCLEAGGVTEGESALQSRQHLSFHQDWQCAGSVVCIPDLGFKAFGNVMLCERVVIKRLRVTWAWRTWYKNNRVERIKRTMKPCWLCKQIHCNTLFKVFSQFQHMHARTHTHTHTHNIHTHAHATHTHTHVCTHTCTHTTHIHNTHTGCIIWCHGKVLRQGWSSLGWAWSLASCWCKSTPLCGNARKFSPSVSFQCRLLRHSTAHACNQMHQHLWTCEKSQALQPLPCSDTGKYSTH